MKTEIGEIPDYCQSCGKKYGEPNVYAVVFGHKISFGIVERADARSVCLDCNEKEEIQQAEVENETRRNKKRTREI